MITKKNVNPMDYIISFKQDIMSKLLEDDFIVYALSDISWDFKNSIFPISNEILSEFSDNIADFPSIKNDKIYRYSLKHRHIIDSFYISDILVDKVSGNLIYYDVVYNEGSTMSNLRKNNVFVPCEVYFYIFCHDESRITKYGNRSDLICQRVIDIMQGGNIGRKSSKQSIQVNCYSTKPRALMVGRFHGREVIFSVSGFIGCD